MSFSMRPTICILLGKQVARHGHVDIHDFNTGFLNKYLNENIKYFMVARMIFRINFRKPTQLSSVMLDKG